MKKSKDPNVLTKREKDIMKFIGKQVNVNGYPPSVREIGKAVRIKIYSNSTWLFSKTGRKRIFKKGTAKRKNT